MGEKHKITNSIQNIPEKSDLEYFKYFKNKPLELLPNSINVDKELLRKEKESDINNVNAIIGRWIADQEQNTRLRRNYAYTLFVLMAGQIISVNIMLYLMGCGIMQLESNYFNMFLSSIAAEAIGFVYIVAKYLFKHNDRVLEEIIKLFKNSDS
ncbi:MAG TPA: hypothetical protein VIK77_01990 [Tissierellaceae bacterium]